MELPNLHFEDFPIEFKEINPSDFKTIESLDTEMITSSSDVFVVDEKIEIEADENGFINENLQSNIDITQKNTVVINASVGSGKSYAIIQTIKRYYNSDDQYLIIVATPLVSLVEQYVNDIHTDAQVPLDGIYNYVHLGRDFNIDYKTRKVQVITVNLLLGNPGEDKLTNTKRSYINNLIQKCKNEDIKVVFIYDEIHDAIQNFKEEYIFNLWKWKDVIHKNFIISATFNEASKVVIEYLAELTDNKIQIIESRRLAIPEKQSELHLHYNPENRLDHTNKVLEKVVTDVLSRNKNIDILCFSKSLAENIIGDTIGIGQNLKDRFGEINVCTTALKSKNRKYSSKKQIQ